MSRAVFQNYKIMDGNSKEGKAGEKAGIDAYKENDNFKI